MSVILSRRRMLQLSLAAGTTNLLPFRAQAGTPSPHDFDHFLGSWNVHHRRLKQRLANNDDWQEFEGSCHWYSVLGGQANINERLVNLPSGASQGVGLRVFDQKSGTWADWNLSLGDPHKIDVPNIGRFENGVGAFVSDDTFNGKPIKVRGTFSMATPTTPQWDQAFSPDGGKTWETNWIMRYTRTADAEHVIGGGAKPIAHPAGGDQHDFDSFVGRWHGKNRRLKERLAGSTEWIEFEGEQEFRLLVDGSVNVTDNLFNMPGGAYRGLAIRAFDPKTRTWAIWWLDGRNPHKLDVPVIGRFSSGTGAFYADDTFNGKPIKVRFIWSNISAGSRHWEQAFSPDGGKTWETNWTAELTKIG